MTHPETPDDALRVLQEGNERHRSGASELRTHSPLGDRHAEGQRPFAALIACADSRVSPSLIFDLDRGNLFVSRVAGNTVDTGTLGSTEYAVAALGVKLVMALGHGDCGAVKAAIDVAGGQKSYARALPDCVAANAGAQAAALTHRAPIIGPAIEAGKVSILAAVYEIETGGVELL